MRPSYVGNRHPGTPALAYSNCHGEDPLRLPDAAELLADRGHERARGRCAWPTASSASDVYEWSHREPRRPSPSRRAAASSSTPTIAARQGRQVRDPLRLRRHQRARGRLHAAAHGAAPARGAARRPGRALHRRLCARARRPARQLPRDHPLGEPAGAARGVPARPAERPGLQHRPRPLHRFGGHSPARPDA